MQKDGRRNRFFPNPMQKQVDFGPNPFATNLNEAARRNNFFRTTLWTGENLQLTLMSIQVNEDIGLEVHRNTDQFIYIVEGQGVTMMGDRQDCLNYRQNLTSGYGVFVPAGTWHNIINTGRIPLKLFTVYAPPEHPHGTVHRTKAEAEKHDY